MSLAERADFVSYVYGVKRQPEQQIALLLRVIEMNPSSATAYANLGSLHALAGRPDDAIANLEKAMRLSPRDPGLWLWHTAMGWAHFAAGRYDEAVAWAERTLQLRPDAALAYRTLAASYAQLGRIDEARRALAGGVRLEPGVSVTTVRQQNPMPDSDFHRRWLDGLRTAGLKE